MTCTSLLFKIYIQIYLELLSPDYSPAFLSISKIFLEILAKYLPFFLTSFDLILKNQQSWCPSLVLLPGPLDSRIYLGPKQNLFSFGLCYK